MQTATLKKRKYDSERSADVQPYWQRMVLLLVLGYESIGCLLGGSLLIAAPDGSFMDMPVEILNGVFNDFLIPGIVLFGLGILNTIASVLVLRRSPWDWFMSCIAIGGLIIWFIVELFVINELHWLHAMWGIPVLIAWAVIIPLIISRHDSLFLRRFLLACGILSSLWYAVINIYVLMRFEAYSIFSHVPIESSASAYKIRVLWVILVSLYYLLFVAFGWGVWHIAARKPALRNAGITLILYCLVSLYWFPMYHWDTMTFGSSALIYTIHIIWTVLSFLLMILVMQFGAAALGKTFRIFTGATFLMFIVFGALTFGESLNINLNLQISIMELWDRIIIIAFMLWIMVFAITLSRNAYRGNRKDFI